MDGTLLMVDISDFTPLTERLAARGPVGGELLTQTLDRVFSRLLTIAHERGGDLLKFGGDALLLLFTGEVHERRAVDAAVLMRRALAAPGVRSDPVRFRLRASMGLAAGPVDLFLVGQRYRELVVLGPVVDETLAMESAADAGEILVNEATARRLSRDRLGPRKAAGRLVTDTFGPSVDSGGNRRPEPAVTASSGPFLTPALREAVARRQLTDGEHRGASVGFVRFEGTTAMLADVGPERVMHALHQLVTTVQQVSADLDVSVVTLDAARDGGKALLVAGVPRTAGDDADRLASALLRILDKPVDGLVAGAGMQVGHIYAGPLGIPSIRAYALMGDVVNTAARLTYRAAPDTLLCSTAAASLLSHDFAATRLEDVQVKGKSRPIAVAQVARAGTRNARDDTVQLVGRSAEVTTLQSLVDDVRRGTGGVVTIEGVAGQGKSRLAAAVHDAIGDLPTLLVRGTHYDRSTPYAACRAGLLHWLAATTRATRSSPIRSLTGAVRARRPGALEMVALMAPVIGEETALTTAAAEVAPDRRAPRSHELWADLLATPGVPLVVVVEDAHWLDSASSALLDEIVRRSASAPVAVIATRRPGADGWTASEGTTLALGPLDDAASMELLRVVTSNRPLHPDRERQVLERASGNPLFIRQLVDSARRNDGALPLTVEAVVAANLDALRPAVRELVQTAAVLGPAMDTELLARVHQCDEPTARRLIGAAAGILAEADGGVVFDHVLVRDTAYSQLSFARRRLLHRRCAEHLERQLSPDLGMLALHWFEAGDPTATEYNMLAAKDARARGAPAEAAAYLERAIAMARRSRLARHTTVPELYRDRGDCLLASGSFDEAYDELGRALRLTPATDRGSRSAILLQRGLVRERQSRYRDALRSYQRALDEVDDGDPLVVEIDVARAGVLYRQGQNKHALEVLLGLMPGAERFGRLGPLAQACKLTAFILAERGEPGADSYLDRAMELYDELGDLSGQAGVLNNRAAVEYGSGDWHASADHYRAAIELYERAGHTVDASLPALNLGELYLYQGRYEHASQILERTRNRWMGVGYRIGVSFAESLLGLLAVRRMEPAGEQLLTSARTSFEQQGAASLALIPAVSAVEGALAAGRFDDVISMANRIRPRLYELEQHLLLCQLERSVGIAAYRLGDSGGGRRALAVAVGEAELCQSRSERAFALEAIAYLTDDRRRDEARALFRELGVVASPIAQYCGGDVDPLVGGLPTPSAAADPA